MADEMTRFENAYNQLLAMGFTQEEVYQLLDGNDVKGLTNITKKDAIDVMVLYFRTKKLLEDSHVQQVIKGNAHLKGAASLPKDVQTLFCSCILLLLLLL